MMNMTAADGPAGDFAIRRATAADAEALSAFAATVFRETFAPDNDPMDMQAYLSDAFTPEKQAAEIADGSCVCFIAEVGETLAGYCAAIDGGVCRRGAHRWWHNDVAGRVGAECAGDPLLRETGLH